MDWELLPVAPLYAHVRAYCSHVNNVCSHVTVKRACLLSSHPWLLPSFLPSSQMALLWFNPWSSSPYKFYKAVIKLTNIIICKSSAEKLSSLRIYPVVDFLLIARLMYNNCGADSRQPSPHVGESKTVLDSGFRTVDSGIQGTGFQYLSAELGFWIPIVSGVLDFKT